MNYILFLMLTLSFTVGATTLKKIKGTVTINGKKAQENAFVYSGDTIEAQGKTSLVQIFFNDGSRSLLRNGKMTITEDQKNHTTVLNLAKGLLFSSKEKSRNNLRVKTSNAVMGIRGTKFYVEETDKDTYLCVCEGEVEIKNDKSVARVSQNQDVHASKGQAFSKSQANQMMIDMARSGFVEMGLLKK